MIMLICFTRIILTQFIRPAVVFEPRTVRNRPDIHGLFVIVYRSSTGRHCIDCNFCIFR